jgi:uncharacterized protein (TIGR02246 family)
MDAGADREAISDLVNEYAKRLDARDFAGFAELFTSDGEWIGGLGQAQGPAAIRELMDTTMGNREDRLGTHVLSNLTIRLSGASATTHLLWTYIEEDESGEPRVTSVGHYEDLVVRADDGRWRFQRRHAAIRISRASGVSTGSDGPVK